MAKKIYLLGGGSLIEMELEKFDKQVFEELNNKKVYVLDFAKSDETKIEKYKMFLKDYFEKFGAEEVNFSSDRVSIEKHIKNIEESGLINILGGDTELLIDRLNKKGLVNSIKSFGGIIVGNSAGSYLMCKKYIKIREQKINEIKSLGIVDILMKAHYTNEFDTQLLKISEKQEIYGVPDKSVIVVEGKDKINFIGNVYLFSNGQKSKVN